MCTSTPCLLPVDGFRECHSLMNDARVPWSYDLKPGRLDRRESSVVPLSCPEGHLHYYFSTLSVTVPPSLFRRFLSGSKSTSCPKKPNRRMTHCRCMRRMLVQILTVVSSLSLALLRAVHRRQGEAPPRLWPALSIDMDPSEEDQYCGC